MTLRLRYAAHSEIGLIRKNNQDSGYVSPRLLVVADGMGGAAAGDLASAAAVRQLQRADRGEDETPLQGEQMLELLAGQLHLANEKIADLVAHDSSLEGMGTTVTAALFDGSQLGLVHIGDSRAYLLHDHELTRLSHDHSWVQSLVDEGKLNAEEAADHPHRSLLLKVLNGQTHNDPDTALVELHDGDRLLFCSDGLCGLVEDPELADILGDYDDLDQVMGALIDAAHREGGIDNITIIVADVETVGARTGPESTAPMVIGAAAEREVPVVPPRPVDHEPTRRLDEAGNPMPNLMESPDEEDEETTRYAPTLRRPGHRRFWRIGVTVIVVVGLLAAALGAGYAWSRTQYFVGTSGQQVAIHRGLAESVLGLPLSEVYEVQDINLADLPPLYREKVVKTITAHSLDEARSTTAELKELADRCIAQRRESTAPPPTSAPSPPTSAPPTSAPPTPAQTATVQPTPTQLSPTDQPAPRETC